MFLALDFATALPAAVAVLLALSTIALALANLAHARNNLNLAEDLDVAHEALDVVGQVGAKVVQGAALPDALLAVGPSDEAQDLLRRFKAFAHLACFFFVLSVLTGCNGIDPKKKAAWLDEIATITSLALENPTLRPDQKDKIAARCAQARAHGEEWVK